jgi:hypothetical protein
MRNWEEQTAPERSKNDEPGELDVPEAGSAE